MKKITSHSKAYSIVIKIAIFILLGFALYKQLFNQNQINTVFVHLKMELQQSGFFLLGLSIFLMFCNWGLEAYKWQMIINRIIPIKYWRAYKAVWTGITLGLFTPNRIGEYGGRILYIPSKFRLKGIVASLIGSFAQILATLLMGILALIFFIFTKQNLEEFSFLAIIVISILLILSLILAYYNLSILVAGFKKVKLFKRIQPYLEVLYLYPSAQYTKYLFLSILRYAVFAAQYLIFLKLFGVQLRLDEGAIVIGVIYLAQTIVPSFTIIELFTRGNIAVYFLGFYGDHEFGAVAASTCMWILNLIIPATLGYFFIIKYNFFKRKINSNGY